MSAGNQTQAQISAANLSNIETICHNVTARALHWALCSPGFEAFLGNNLQPKTETERETERESVQWISCKFYMWRGAERANLAWQGGLTEVCLQDKVREGSVSSAWTTLIIADKSQTSVILLHSEVPRSTSSRELSSGTELVFPPCYPACVHNQ